MDTKASRTSVTSGQDGECENITHSRKSSASGLIMHFYPREKVVEGCSSSAEILLKSPIMRKSDKINASIST